MISLKPQARTQEICRMSWFLVEMDEGQSKGGKPNGNTVYGVIHSIDLIENDSSNIYVNRKVKFNWNHAIIHGKVKLASDDRYFIEQQFKTLSKDNEEAAKKLKHAKRFLVQFNKGPNTISHSIVHQKEIIWPKEDFRNSTIREVLIRDEKIQRMATVLHVNDSDELMHRELDILKSRCFEGAYKDPNDNVNINFTPWILVQYSSGPSNVTYSVVNINDTVWQAENLYPNVVAYLKENGTVFQAIIVRKSQDRNTLDQELKMMKDSCLMAEFPISNLTYTPKIALPPLDHQALCAKPAILCINRDELQIIRN